ncbi:MAG TPA: hypothetical protein VLF79_03440 [Candidatus Saccharimonadales bacterium]|nr:hypothetical protein [Candidatus Saccharimonadales bacterium]
MNITKLVPTFLITIFATIAVIYTFQFSRLLGNTLFLLPPFVAVIAGAYTVRTYRLANVHGKAMALFTAGLLCLLTGEFIFYLFQFVFHTDPFPSIADIFYLAAYPLLFAGFVKEIRIHKVNWRTFDKLVLVLVTLLLLTLAIIVSYFGIYLAYDAGNSLIANIIAIAYGVGDLILIVPSLFILKIALDYRGGKLFYSWTLMLLAVMFMMAGDILFAIYSNEYTELVWPYTMIDLTWVVSYLCFAYSFSYTSTTIRALHTKLLK